MTPEAFDRLQKSVDRIERAIIGDDEMGHQGLAHRVECMEKKLMGHDRQIWQWIGAITILGLLVPFLTKYLF